MSIASPEPKAAPPLAPAFIRPMHEGFPVKDAEVSLKFYTQVLGLTILPRPNIGPGYWVGTPDRAIEFHIIQTDKQYIPGPDAKSAAQSRHTAWLIDSLDVMRARLNAFGVFYTETHGLVGADQLFFVDPDGHTWEFQEPAKA